MSVPAVGNGGASWRAWLTTNTPASRLQARAVQSYLAWLSFRRNPMAMLGLFIIVALVLMAAFAPLLATHDPNAQALQDRLLTPGEGATCSVQTNLAAIYGAASSTARARR